MIQRVKEVNTLRKTKAPGHQFVKASKDDTEVQKDPAVALDFHIAPPQMRKYMEISSLVYGIYLKYIAPEDIHVYSIDEVFMDVTNYLAAYKMTARELVKTMIADVLNEDYIAIPSSLHEFIIVRKSVVTDSNHLRKLVKEANHIIVRPEDVLSDNILYYCKSNQCISVL